MMGEYNRDVSRKKALRKRRISSHYYWTRREGKDYYDNLHQYSKNKIHCSDPCCSVKTRNKGKRRYRKGAYHRAINYKRQDLVRMIEMDQSMEEVFGHIPKRRVTKWI